MFSYLTIIPELVQPIIHLFNTVIVDQNSATETGDPALQDQVALNLPQLFLQTMSRKIRNLLLSPDLYNSNICQKDCCIALFLVPSAEVL